MKKTRLMLPLFAVALGACSTYTPMLDSDQSATPGQQVSGKAQTRESPGTFAVEPTTRITNGVSADRAAYLAGKSLLSEHRIGPALDSFVKALSLNPKMVDAYVGIGIAHSIANRQPLAIAAFDEAVRLEPSNAQWRANLGMAYARNGEFQKASAELSRAWAMAPSNKRIEAQYQRVAETARLEQVVAEQAAARQASIDASGMTVITGDDTGGGMRRVSKRVYELDLAPKVAQPATAIMITNPVMTSARAPAVASPPPLVSAEAVEPTAQAEVRLETKLAKTEPIAREVVASKLPSPMLPPVPQMVSAPDAGASDTPTSMQVKVKAIAASVEQVQITEMPAKDEPIDKKPESPMQTTLVEAAAAADTETMMDQRIQAQSAEPMALMPEQVAKAEAEIARKETPSQATGEQVQAGTGQKDGSLQSTMSREQALALARQRLFERKLARARIRAARTARIGLEDQAQSDRQQSDSITR